MAEPRRIVQPGKSPLAGTDYTAMLGGNIQGEGVDDPFGGEVPRDTRGYAQYRGFFEQRAMELLGGQGVFKLCATCETADAKGNRIVLRTPKKGHLGGGVVFGCDHLIVHDAANPPDVYFVPVARGGGGYWLCGTCFKLLTERKLNLDRGLCGKCALCLEESLESIRTTHPDRLHDLAAL